MTQNDLERVHEIDKEILSHIISLCTKHNIEYKLVYGSLLGAIRHKGIIPWDPDIDLAMDRRNYNKFMAIAKAEMSPLYNLHISYSSSSYSGMSEMKIGKRGTIYCDSGVEELNISNCVQVDIFLFDYIKDFWYNKKTLGNTILRAVKYASLPWDEKRLLSRSIWSNSKYLSIVLIPLLLLLHLLSIIFSKTCLQALTYYLFINKNNDSRLMGALSDGDMKYFCNTSDFEGIQLLDFEGEKICGPSNPDHLLRQWYGDYMQLPPEDKRYFKGFDTWIFKENIPY